MSETPTNPNQSLQNEWDKKLEKEGMPAEIESIWDGLIRSNPEMKDLLFANTADDLITEYVLKRAMSGMMSLHGEHRNIARIAHNMEPRKSVDEWEQIIIERLEQQG